MNLDLKLGPLSVKVLRASLLRYEKSISDDPAFLVEFNRVRPPLNSHTLALSLERTVNDVCFKYYETVPPTGRGGNRGSFPQVPSVMGAPNSAELFQIRSCSSFTSQSSFFKRFVSLDFKSACFFALRLRC